MIKLAINHHLNLNNPASQAVIRRIDWRRENAALAPLITVITANNMCAGGGINILSIVPNAGEKGREGVPREPLGGQLPPPHCLAGHLKGTGAR